MFHEKGFVAIDSQLAGELGRSIMIFLALIVTFTTITIIGGPPFALVAVALGGISYKSTLVDTLRHSHTDLVLGLKSHGQASSYLTYLASLSLD